jgi:hypothetical protein
VTRDDHRNRDYWLLGKSLSSVTQQTLTMADILIVPWEKFRKGEDVFPEYTTELFKFIQRSEFASQFAIACDSEAYGEIHLHGDMWRLPTLFLSYVALPLAINILSSFLFANISDQTGRDHIEVSFIIEPPTSPHPCVSLSYKGPVSDFPQKVLAEAERCFSGARQQAQHAVARDRLNHQQTGGKQSKN